jgi:hypothetical protein
MSEQQRKVETVEEFKLRIALREEYALHKGNSD